MILLTQRSTSGGTQLGEELSDGAVPTLLDVVTVISGFCFETL